MAGKPGRSGARPVPLVVRFWRHVQKTETCWLWLGSNSYGSPRFRVRESGKLRGAPYVAWELSGLSMPPNAILMRACAGELCVRPEHHRVAPRSAVRRRPAPPEKFWERVRKGDGCWEWTGARTTHGYGANYLKSLRLSRAAHRAAWELTHGPIPPGLEVRHYVCDNPPCCNPAHLRLGTHKENMEDMARKGRGGGGALPGERHRLAKLTEAQVREMRELYARGGVSHAEVGRRYGVTKTTAGEIIRRQSWSHLD